ncbi:hypothetical protein REC12_21645 [Desulfosporosinus sp. PR]|uniref:hypothetical protein n=1 Tax=Candidatus Desulfosporosinus nitrosoreducens TaxID=3401928 RepID=UPI0027EDB37A|nr:hypothetical protein [Desulfosporosinus sp. PR]MDQ7096204.1 hypothetical protein [Desulfosporosinus sp. PR]
MVDYYRYLWSTTWPNMVVLILIWIFVLFRIGGKVLRTFRYERDAWGFLVLFGKTVLLAGVLGIYTQLLFSSQPDWLAQPGFLQGLVQGKTFDSTSGTYSLEVRSGSEQQQLYVDKNIYENLKLEDQVKLMYLPVRKEVVRCERVGSLL